MTIIFGRNSLSITIQFQPHIPIYASCLFFELHKSDGDYHIEIFYKRYRGEDKEPLEPLFIPECGKKCSLKKLYKLYKDIIPKKDFDQECNIDKLQENSANL